MDRIREEAASSLKRATETMKEFYDQKRSDFQEYKVGDKVYVEASNISSMHPTKKLDNKRFGPFEIIENIGSSLYRLKLPGTWSIHPVFNESLLTPDHPPEFPSQDKPPPPPSIENSEGNLEYNIEEIVDSRVDKKGRFEYLIKWKGYPSEENTWEPIRHLKNSQKTLVDYC